MNSDTKNRIILYIRKNDPDGIVIKKIEPDSDFKGGKIIYNKDNLTIHRNISDLGDEEYVRAFLLVKLVSKLNYPAASIELEKPYEAGRPKTIKPRIDILVRDKRSKKSTESTFLFIEVKAPEKFESDKKYIEGQLFKLSAIEDKDFPVKYLVYYSLNDIGSLLEDKVIIVDNKLFTSYQKWNDSGQITLDQIPESYGIASKLVYVNKKDSDLNSNEKNLDKTVLKDHLDYLRNDLHNVLWGGGGMNYNDIFSNLVKLFLTKIFDEDTTFYGEPYKFQIEFKYGKPESPLEIYKKINKLFKQAQKEYLGYSDEMLEDSIGIDREKISEAKIVYVIEQLQGISLLENENKDDGDLLGNFFEGIVSVGFKQDKGQFFTHQNIINFILAGIDAERFAIELLNGKENPVKPRLPYICDCACGSGTFLIEYMKIITHSVLNQKNLGGSKKTSEFIASNFPDLKPNVWAKEYIYGCEINPDLGLATKVNMVLHGDGNINVFVGDEQGNGLNPFTKYIIPNKISLLQHNETIKNFSYNKPINGSFDIVVSNPPFSIEKKALPPSEELEKLFMYYDKSHSENLFIERWYQLLKENGRLGVVLPESVFDTTENLYIRLFLYKYFKIKAIISLPDLAFQPFTQTKTSLLFAQKKSKEEVEKYEEEWRKFSNEFQRLKRRIKKYQEKISNTAEEKNDLKKYLKHYYDEKVDASLNSLKLLDKYQDEINEIHSNQNWWVFNEISKIFDYEIFMAEAKEIGYKRTKRGEKKTLNDLFQTDDRGDLMIFLSNMKTILDHFRSKVTWD